MKEVIIEVIINVLKQTLQYLYEIIIVTLIEVVVDLLKDIVEYFKGLSLNRKKHTAFVMSTDADVNSPIASLIDDSLKGKGIVEGVYNRESDKIESLRYIGGNGISTEITDKMDGSPVVVFS